MKEGQRPGFFPTAVRGTRVGLAALAVAAGLALPQYMKADGHLKSPERASSSELVKETPGLHLDGKGAVAVLGDEKLGLGNDFAITLTLQPKYREGIKGEEQWLLLLHKGKNETPESHLNYPSITLWQNVTSLPGGKLVYYYVFQQLDRGCGLSSVGFEEAFIYTKIKNGLTGTNTILEKEVSVDEYEQKREIKIVKEGTTLSIYEDHKLFLTNRNIRSDNCSSNNETLVIGGGIFEKDNGGIGVYENSVSGTIFDASVLKISGEVIGLWNFTKSTADQVGTNHGFPVGSAKLVKDQ